MTPDRPDPILLAPPRVVARGGVSIRGRGTVTAVLRDGAEVTLRLTAAVAYVFTGTGAVRVPRPDVRVFAGAVGTLDLRGDPVALDVGRGVVELTLVGVFDVTFDARADVVAGDGTRFAGRGAGRTVRVEGTRVADVGGGAHAGGAAA